MTRATDEQAQALAGLVKGADEVRRVAKEDGARAGRADGGAGRPHRLRQPPGHRRGRRGAGRAESTTVTEQLARSVEEMRVRARGKSPRTTAQQARTATTTAAEVREVAGRLAQLDADAG